MQPASGDAGQYGLEFASTAATNASASTVGQHNKAGPTVIGRQPIDVIDIDDRGSVDSNETPRIQLVLEPRERSAQQKTAAVRVQRGVVAVQVAF